MTEIRKLKNYEDHQPVKVPETIHPKLYKMIKENLKDFIIKEHYDTDMRVGYAAEDLYGKIVEETSNFDCYNEIKITTQQMFEIISWCSSWDAKLTSDYLRGGDKRCLIRLYIYIVADELCEEPEFQDMMPADY
jgi:hypothetical protein